MANAQKPERTTHEYSDPAGTEGLILRAAGFLGGLLLPALLLGVYFAASGAFQEFWSQGASLIVNRLGDPAELYEAAYGVILSPTFFFWALACVGVVMMWWDWRVRLSYRFALSALLICSLAAVALAGRYSGPEFMAVFPALALLAGVAVSRAVWLIRNDTSIELFLAGTILLLFASSAGAAVAGHGMLWLVATPEEASKRMHLTSLFNEAARIGAYLKERCPETARIAVIGSEPELLFYAQRLSATKRVVWERLEGPEHSCKVRAEMAAEIERAEPDYIVFVDDVWSWPLDGEFRGALSNWWRAYWPGRMDLVQTAGVASEIKMELVPNEGGWTRNGNLLKEGRILVFRRKQGELQ